MPSGMEVSSCSKLNFEDEWIDLNFTLMQILDRRL